VFFQGFAKMPDNVRPFFWPFTICHLGMVQLLHCHIFNAVNYPLCPLCNTRSGLFPADTDSKGKAVCPECKAVPPAPYLLTPDTGFYICRALGCKNMFHYHESVEEHFEKAQRAQQRIF